MLKRAEQETVLEPSQVGELRAQIGEFSSCFTDKPGRTSLVEHDIKLTTQVPIRSKPNRTSARQREILDQEIKRMLEMGIIVPAESEYTSPLILVEAPGKSPRPCVDYRKLNAITCDQVYPIPNIEETVEMVSSAKFVSTLDLTRGYWQVPLTERASRFASFISPLGSFWPVVLSCGLKNAPFCFSHLMNRILRGLQDFALPHLDDIAVFSDSWEGHMSHLREVLNRLLQSGLTIKAEKCQLGRAEVNYLGLTVGQGFRRPSELKIAAIAEYPRPLPTSVVL